MKVVRLIDVLLVLVRLVLDGRIADGGQAVLTAHLRDGLGEPTRDVVGIPVMIRVVPELEQHRRAGVLREADGADH